MHYVGISVHSVLYQCIHTNTHTHISTYHFKTAKPTGLKVDIATWPISAQNLLLKRPNTILPKHSFYFPKNTSNAGLHEPRPSLHAHQTSSKTTTWHGLRPTMHTGPYLSRNKPPTNFHSNQWKGISSLPSQQRSHAQTLNVAMHLPGWLKLLVVAAE